MTSHRICSGRKWKERWEIQSIKNWRGWRTFSLASFFTFTLSFTSWLRLLQLFVAILLSLVPLPSLKNLRMLPPLSKLLSLVWLKASTVSTFTNLVITPMVCLLAEYPHLGGCGISTLMFRICLLIYFSSYRLYFCWCSLQSFRQDSWCSWRWRTPCWWLGQHCCFFWWQGYLEGHWQPNQVDWSPLYHWVCFFNWYSILDITFLHNHVKIVVPLLFTLLKMILVVVDMSFPRLLVTLVIVGLVVSLVVKYQIESRGNFNHALTRRHMTNQSLISYSRQVNLSHKHKTHINKAMQ